MLLTFMTIHLLRGMRCLVTLLRFQFRFGDTDQFGPYYIRPPPYLINFWGIFSLNLFWTDAQYVQPVGVRDIYVPGRDMCAKRLRRWEFQIFKHLISFRKIKYI